MSDAHARGWGDPSSKTYRDKYIIGVDVGGLPRLYLRHEVAHLFMGFLQEIIVRGYKLNGVRDDWGYAYRPIRGYEQKWADTHDFHWLSNHSWGLALDLDSTDHPMGTHKDFPAWVVEVAHKWGLAWGGDYVNRPDPMHFEFTGTPADVTRYPLGGSQPQPLVSQPIVTTYPEALVKSIDIQIDTDAQGKGYQDLPDVPARTVVNVMANTGNPTAGGYKPIPDVARIALGNGSRIVVEEAIPNGRIDVTVWVAA